MFIGNLATGDAAVTVFKLDYVPQYLLIGDTATDNPLEGFSIAVDGTVYQNINNNIAAVRSMSKLGGEALLGTDVKISQLLKVANGYIPGRSCVLTLVNSGAGTPAVYEYSTRMGTSIFNVGYNSVNPSSSVRVSGVEGLFFDSTNLDYVEIHFAGMPTPQKLTLPEVQSLFALTSQADVDGQLGTLLSFDFVRMGIVSVNVWSTDAGSITLYTLG